MHLNENELYSQLSEIKKGDVITIVGNRTKVHFSVENISGNQLQIKNSDTKFYNLTPSTAIEGNVITLYRAPMNKEVPFTFDTIIVSDNKRVEKFKVLPEVKDGPDPAIEEKKLADAKKNRTEILKKLGDLQQFSVFTVFVGDYIFDKEGDSIIKSGSESQIVLEVDSFDATLYTCSLVSSRGKYKKLFDKYKLEDFYINMGSTLFNTSENFIKRVALQIFHESNSKSPIIVADVYNIEIEEEKEGEEDEESEGELDEPRSMEDLLKDKDLMKLMNYQSIWDKALGRKSKGIKPIDDLKHKEPLNTLFGFDKKPGQRVTFRYLGDEDLKGDKLFLKRGQTYEGKMLTSSIIQLSVRNSREKIFISVGKTPLKDNKRNITVTYNDPQGVRNKDIEIHGQIQITK